MLSFFVWARPQIAVAIVDPYNTVLCIYSLPECNVDIEHPSYMNLNRLLAQIIYLVIDGISSFDGTLNVDFIEVEVQSSLVPYPRILSCSGASRRSSQQRETLWSTRGSSP